MHIRSRALSVRGGPGKALQPLGDSSSYRRQRPPRGRPVPALPLGQAGPLPPPLHVPVPQAPSVPFMLLLLQRALRFSPQTLSGVGRREGAPSRRRVVAVPQEGTALWQAITRHTYAYKHRCLLRGLEVATFSRGSDCDPLVLDKEPNPPASPPIPQGF